MIKQRKRKRYKKKNPELQKVVENILSKIDHNNKIEFEYISDGSYAEIYKFNLKSNKLVDNKILKSGNYVLKIFRDPAKDKEINQLTKFSNYGLIPKIFIINKNFIIMKFIEGKTLWKFIEINDSFNRIIFLKIERLIQKYHQLGFVHGDLHPDNILITNKINVYFIDPDIYYQVDEDYD